MTNTQPEPVLQPVAVDGHSIETGWRESAEQDMHRAMDRMNPAMLVGLADIVEERRPQQIWITVACIDQQLVDAQVMSAVEGRKPREETPLRITGQQALQFRVDGCIGATANGMSKLADAPQRTLEPVALNGCRR
jgi:hypothetical protein